MTKSTPTNLQCTVLGCGAWGPGFCNWQELVALLLSNQATELSFTKPAPQIIPTNERRRAPLVVKMAVETSCQAIAASSLAPQNVACVFGSGLGDNDITDYLCRVLITELKQISPTKFHNSVHNAAAGYWTISTGCMEATNSVAAYQHTAGMIMLEAMTQCQEQQQPVLITIYDTEVGPTLKELFPCDQNFSLSLLIAPCKKADTNSLKLELTLGEPVQPTHALTNPALEQARQNNPAGQLLSLLENIALLEREPTGPIPSCELSISATYSIFLQLEKQT